MVKGKVLVLSLAILLVLVSLSLVSATATILTVNTAGTSAINTTAFSATKNVNSLYNISINISSAVPNITAVIITLPSNGFLSDVSSANFSDAGVTFKQGANFSLNASTVIINWTANITNSQGFLFNYSKGGNTGLNHYFWFNANSNMSYRGTQNLTVTIYVGNGSVATYYNFTFLANINDTFAIPFSSKTNTTGTNLSAKYLYYEINFSHLALANGSAVTMNISVYNATALVNYTYVATNNSAGDIFKFNLTTANARYNINVTVNNSLGEYNTSSRRIILDSTGPTITFSCTVYTIIVTNAMSCSCSVADLLDGSAAASYTTSPSTTATGNNFPVVCMSTDSAGNTNTSTLYYNVTLSGSSGGGSSAGGGGGGGGATTTWAFTYSANDKELSEKGAVSYSLSGSNRIKVKVNAEDHYVGVVSVTATTAKIQVSSTPQEAIMGVGEIKKFDVNNDGYYDLSVTLDSITSGKAKVTTNAIREAVPVAPSSEETAPELSPGEDVVTPTNKPTRTTVIWMVVIALVIAIAAVLVAMARKMKKKKKW